MAIIAVSAEVFHPLGIDPEFLGSTVLASQSALGVPGIALASVGILFAVGGAAIDTCFSGAYTLSQYLGWEWGKYRRPSGAPRFTLAWMILLALAFVIVSTGVDPVMVTEYAVIGSVVALPFTYLPILLIARDPVYMGENTNGVLANVLGWLYFCVILVVAVSAIPLLIVTHAGAG
jgi:Mn2+/Fe2+ NRAMP family transporter